MLRTSNTFIILFGVWFFWTPALSQDRPLKLDTSRSDASLDNAQAFFFYLSQREVKEDLELAGEQVDLIEKRVAEIQKGVEEYRLALRALRREPDAESKTKMLHEEQLAKMSTQLELVRSELLPHQRKRMSQVAFQYEIVKTEGANPFELFLVPRLVDELKISEVQAGKIEEVYKSRDEQLLVEYEKYEKRFREIQQQTYDRILANLSVEQKSEIVEQIGPPSAVFLSPSRFGDLKQNK